MRLAITAATAMTLQKTGATAQSQQAKTNAQQAQAFASAAHPRGADGRFINTGGTVQIVGPDGKPISEGTAQVIQTNAGTVIQVTNPTTGQVSTVSPSQVIQAPVSIATLGAKGTQGISTAPGGAARAGAADARLGIPPRSGVDALGQQASKALMDAYTAAYVAQQGKMATAAAKKAAAAAKKAAALAKKNSKLAGGSAYNSPITMANKRRFYR